MNTSGVGQSRMKNPDYCPAFRVMSLCLLLVLPLFLLATEAAAAKITFEPNELTVTADPGEVMAVPVVVSLTDATLPSSYANFTLSSVDGTLDSSWITSQPYVSLNSWYKMRQVHLQFSVPTNAKSGEYSSVFRTESLDSNEQVVPVELIINVEVSGTFTCEVPSFSDISYAEDKINVRKHKKVTIDLSGTISVQDGCDILGASYQLIDEYGELDRTESLKINADGTFSVAVPMVASRKGKDKDGRLYTVKFTAENEAGIGESPEISVVVLHDKRKKGHHDSKRRDHDSKRRDHDSKRKDHTAKR